MVGDIVQSDLENMLALSTSDAGTEVLGLDGLTAIDKLGIPSHPQSMYNSDSPIEKSSQDFGRVQSLTNGVTNIMQRRNTSTTRRTSYSDPSAKIWGLYLSQAKKLDKNHSESWIKNIEGVLVFTGLFSATVAAFILVSYQQLQPNPSDVTNQLLTQISQQLSLLPNGTSPSVPLTIANQPPFQPTASAVRVNVLWFTSLALSTDCALWATLMQQWTRRFLQVADTPHNTETRARIRAFFADGMERFGLPAAVEVLPALLHASVLLFYVGLVDFLFNVNYTVAYTLLALVSSAVLVYLLLTIMPLYYHNSPYQTPLTSLVWFVIEASPLFVLWLRPRTNAVKMAICERLTKIRHGMRHSLEMQVDNTVRIADARALKWTLRSLDEDDKMEEFLDGLPGLFQISVGNHAQVIKRKLEGLVEPVIEQLFVTCIPRSLPEEIRIQRLGTCLGAIWCFASTIERHFRAICDQWIQPTNDLWGLLSKETWIAAARMTTDSNPLTAIRAHCIQALVAVMWRKGKWACLPAEASSLLQDQLGASAVDIDKWYENEDHLQLVVAANLLSNVLPLLRKLETTNGPDVSFKNEIKAILNMICDELIASDVPHELRARFANGHEVMEVFGVQRHFRRRPAIDTQGSWTKIFTPIEIGRGN